MARTPFILLLLFLFQIPFAVQAESDPNLPQEIALLNNEGDHVLDQIATLRQEAADLQVQADQLQSEMEKARERLKKISAASTPARRYARFLKKTEPEYETLLTQLHQKKEELKSRQASFEVIESKMNWIDQDSTAGELNETLSRFVVP